MNRREFLGKLATAAITAAIAPKLLAQAAEELPTAGAAVNSTLTPPSPLTLSMLEEAYQNVVFGYDEPDLCLMSVDTYAEFSKLIPLRFEPRTKQEVLSCPRFNNADVAYNRALPKGSWMFVNSESHNPRTSGVFSKHDLSWHPIPTEL